MSTSSRQNSSWWKRLGWLFLLWTASVATLGVVAYLLRIVMATAGLTR